MKALILICASVACLCFALGVYANNSAAGGSFTDPRDGKTYRTVRIGERTWMAENLNYAGSGGDVGVCYDDNPSNCNTYGRLYTWAEAMSGSSSSNADPSGVQGVCPAGWHLPSDAEWTALVSAVNTSSTSTNNAAIHLKSQTGWASCGPSGSGSSYQCADTHGFSALPGGYRWSDGSFYNVGNYGFWWSATEDDATDARYRNMVYGKDYVGSYWDGKTQALSVRCVRD